MLKGFESDVFDSQTVFRQVLDAMASPGTIQELKIDFEPPGVLHPSAGAVLMTLLDFETPLWSDLGNNTNEIQWLRFHTGMPCTRLTKEALFALITDYDNLTDIEAFNPGTIESPDLSCTLIIQTRGIDNTGRMRLTGPGIRKDSFLRLKGIREAFLKKRNRFCESYPRGVDMIFACEHLFCAIPRTTQMELF